jgi:eukaryotic translation initiation factor 2C
MAGPAKKHAKAEKKPQGSSNGSSSASRDPTQRSEPKSVPRLDGNRDPSMNGVLDYTRPTDLKNISEFLGLAGWYAARGVSSNALLSQVASTRTHASVQTLLNSTPRYTNRLKWSANLAMLPGSSDAYKALSLSFI